MAFRRRVELPPPRYSTTRQITAATARQKEMSPFQRAGRKSRHPRKQQVDTNTVRKEQKRDVRAWRRAYGLLAMVVVSAGEADGQLSSVGCQDWSGL